MSLKSKIRAYIWSVSIFLKLSQFIVEFRNIGSEVYILDVGALLSDKLNPYILLNTICDIQGTVLVPYT